MRDRREDPAVWRFVAGRCGSPEMGLSLIFLFLLGTWLLVALLLDGNQAKALRVGLGFLVYVVCLGTVAGRARAVPPWGWFVVASGMAGIVNAALRPEVDPGLVAVMTAGSGLLLGSLHWLAVTRWRDLRERLMPPPGGGTAGRR